MGDIGHCLIPLHLCLSIPARKAAPPLENWIMTGELMSRAAWSTALMVEVDVQLNAGRATLLSLLQTIIIE